MFRSSQDVLSSPETEPIPLKPQSISGVFAYWARGGAADAVAAARRVTPPESHAVVQPNVWVSDRGDVALVARPGTALPEDRFDRQPSLARRLVVAADVRIDNRDDLARLLGVHRNDTAEMPDSELVRLAWARWDAAALSHIIGDFAFAIWNEADRSLTCARDALGARPLFYARIGRTIAIASRPGVLLALPGVSREVDDGRMACHLMGRQGLHGRSFFRDISVVPAGHVLRVTADREVVERYWHPPRAGSIRLRTDAEYVEQFRALYEASVSARLRGVGPVASSLSAGLDSTSVTALAAGILKQHGKMLTAITWAPQSGTLVPASSRITDESALAASVAHWCGNVEHRIIVAPTENPLARLAAFERAAGEPVVNPLFMPMFHATGCLLAAQGATALLTGQRGNLTVSYDGLTMLPALLRSGRVLRWIRETRALRSRGWHSRTLISVGAMPLLPASLHRMLAAARGSSAGRCDTVSAIHPEFLAECAARGLTPRDPREAWSRPADGWEARRHAIDGVDLGATYKGMERVLSAEPRDATADSRLVEFCLGIPEAQFLRDGTTRALLRRTFAGKLPPDVLQARVRGLQGADWPRFVAPYREQFAAELSDAESSATVRRMLDVAALRRLIDDWPTSWDNGARPRYALKLLRGLAAAAFIRRTETDAWDTNAEGRYDL